jgi:hypothetical protein
MSMTKTVTGIAALVVFRYLLVLNNVFKPVEINRILAE